MNCKYTGENTVGEVDFDFTDFLYKSHKSDVFTLAANESFVVIVFCLHGECLCQHNNDIITLKNSEYNILLLPKGKFQFSFCTKNSETILIYLEKEFFFRHLPEEYLSDIKNIDALKTAFPNSLYISPKLRSVINDIDSCELNGHLKNLYIRAKIIELLILQLAQYEEEKTVPGGLKPAEVEKMIIVKDLIDKNPDESYTLTYLARIAGTNEQYLKKHFKMLFGHTVFGYIQECKMQKAKEMLLTGDYRISDIAELTGYKHATHFTSAFKKFFGYLPQEIKTK